MAFVLKPDILEYSFVQTWIAFHHKKDRNSETLNLNDSKKCSIYRRMNTRMLWIHIYNKAYKGLELLFSITLAIKNTMLCEMLVTHSKSVPSVIINDFFTGLLGFKVVHTIVKHELID
jgi:hypothetical protein